MTATKNKSAMDDICKAIKAEFKHCERIQKAAEAYRFGMVTIVDVIRMMVQEEE